jgi:hypothetical protein
LFVSGVISCDIQNFGKALGTKENQHHTKSLQTQTFL